MKKLRTFGILTAGIVAVGLAVPPAAQAATKYFSTTKVVSGTGKALCPAGYRATGGGYEAAADAETETKSVMYMVKKSAPYSTNGWQASGLKSVFDYNTMEISETAYSPKVFVVCAG